MILYYFEFIVLLLHLVGHKVDVLLRDITVVLGETGGKRMLKNGLLMPVAIVFMISPVRAEWTMSVIPDTQNYLVSLPDRFDWFQSQTAWLGSQDIEFVLGTGDITVANDASEWEAIQGEVEAMGLPYILPTGNHDYNPIGGWVRDEWKDTTLYNNYFNETFPGLIPWQQDDWVNSYVRHIAPDGRRLLLLNLEDHPRATVYTWATGVLAQYPYDTVMLATHMNIEEGLVDPNTGEAATARDPFAEELWDWAKTQSNIEMIFNGHEFDGDDTDIDGINFFATRQASIGDDGHTIHEIGFNTQSVPTGGGSWLRQYTFNGINVHAETYAPYLDEWKTDHRNEFTIQLSPIANFTLPEWELEYGNGLDGIDFLNWQRQVTGALGPTTASAIVPEPTSFTLLGAGFAAWTVISGLRLRLRG